MLACCLNSIKICVFLFGSACIFFFQQRQPLWLTGAGALNSSRKLQLSHLRLKWNASQVDEADSGSRIKTTHAVCTGAMLHHPRNSLLTHSEALVNHCCTVTVNWQDTTATWQNVFRTKRDPQEQQQECTPLGKIHNICTYFSWKII